MLILAITAAGEPLASPPAARILERQVGIFGPLRVEEDAEGRRYLISGSDDVQTVATPGEPTRLDVDYIRLSMAALVIAPKPKRILVIGLGGGSQPTFLRHRYPRAAIDVVEIDPAVVGLARRWFGYPADDAQLRTHIMDARRFVEQDGARYDAIFLDAYGGSQVPRHLATVEFFLAIRRRLAPGGVVSANIIGLGADYGRTVAAARAALGEVRLLACGPTWNRILLAAPDRPIPERAAFVGAARALALPWDLAKEIDRGWKMKVPAAAPFHDGLP